ncbi:MAG: hypothetical protein LUQ13_04560 [Methanomicrobiales archaeon]|nr:hypothetical protein [Methanomicrobiales archaeon]
MHLCWRLVAVIMLLTGIGSAAGAAAPALSDTYYTAIYFHSIDCAHCARVDAVLFDDWLRNSSHLVMIDYDAMADRTNIPVLLEYNRTFHTGEGVPILFFGPNLFQVGDTKILASAPAHLQAFENNQSFRAQYGIPFRTITIANIPGNPRIWYQDRVLLRTSVREGGAVAQELLLAASVPRALDVLTSEPVPPIVIHLAQQNRTFQHAVKIPGWILQWNANDLPRAVPEAPFTEPSPVEPSLPQQAPLQIAPFAMIPCIGIGIWWALRMRRF